MSRQNRLAAHFCVKRSARSLYITPESRIYVGSFEEFGYFEKDETGTYHYHSLSDASISPYFQNDDIWTINEHQGEIYFQSFLDYYIYDGKSVRRGASPLPPKYLFASVHKDTARYVSSYSKPFGLLPKELACR